MNPGNRYMTALVENTYDKIDAERDNLRKKYEEDYARLTKREEYYTNLFSKNRNIFT